MTENTITHPRIATRRLNRRNPARFATAIDAATRDSIAADLGLLALPSLRLAGDLLPSGASDLDLRATLEATVVQPCVVTLAPVTTRLAERVERRYVAQWAEPEGGSETELEDDTREPLPETIDLLAVAAEALALALPLYPRAPGAALGEAVFGPPGAEPLRDQDLRPFAALAALKGPPAPE
jgi:uncharacterized metal-binding protein YceD (DUF177 family)